MSKVKRCLSFWQLAIVGYFSNFFNGIYISVYVVIDDMVEEFEISMTMIGWIISLYAVVFGIASLFSTRIINSCGCRPVVMAGGVIAAAGLLLMSLSRHVPMLSVAYSVIGSMGNSFIYTGLVASARMHYTESHYVFANGVTLAGVSTGILVFPPILQLIIDVYGWRGAVLLSAALILNSTVFGALIRPRSLRRKSKINRIQCGKDESTIFIDKQVDSMNSKTPAVRSQTHPNSGDYPAAISNNEADIDPSAHVFTKHLVCSNQRGFDYDGQGTLERRSNCSLDKGQPNTVLCYRHLSSSDLKEESVMNQRIDNASDDVCTFNVHSKHNPIAKCDMEFCFSNLFQLSSQTLTRTKIFCHVTLFINAVLLASSYTAGITYLAPAGTNRGLTPMQAATVLSAQGVSQAVGRFLNGIFVRKGFITSIHLYMLLQFSMVFSCVVLAFLMGIYGIALVGSLGFGLSTGGIVSLNYVMQKVVDEHATSMSLGWMLFFEGLGGTIGGFVLGWLRDVTGSFMAAYLAAAGFTAVSSLLTTGIYFLKQRETRESARMEKVFDDIAV